MDELNKRDINEVNSANEGAKEIVESTAQSEPADNMRPVTQPEPTAQIGHVSQPASMVEHEQAHQPASDSTYQSEAGVNPQHYGASQQNYGASTQQQGANLYQYGGYSQQQKSQPYYTESIKKTKTKKIGAGQLILVSIISSILGACLMFAAVTFVGPVIQPTVNEWFGITQQASVPADNYNNTYKKIEITQSTSPVEAIAEKVGPSIVGIQINVKAQNDNFFFNFGREGTGYGSGIIIREDGYILTNNHVIESALVSNTNRLTEGSSIEVVLPGDTEKRYPAKIVGRDDNTDIAVIKIDVNNLVPAELGDSDKVKVGELAVAIGNPGGLQYMGSVTAGIISGVDRTLELNNGYDFKLIQTDAAINPGNSGGALVNSQGQVIGVNTVKIAATDVEGIGFAIPINEANEIADSLINYKYVKDRPYLGVMIDQSFTEEYANRIGVPFGLLVYEVQPLTAAYKAGIHNSDIILKFNGKRVTTFKELEEEKNKHKPGDEVIVEVYRDGETLSLKVILDEEKHID
jgi:serine protease Do